MQPQVGKWSLVLNGFFFLFRLLRIVRLDVLKTKINKYLSNNCIDKEKSKKSKTKTNKKIKVTLYSNCAILF